MTNAVWATFVLAQCVLLDKSLERRKRFKYKNCSCFYVLNSAKIFSKYFLKKGSCMGDWAANLCKFNIQEGAF